MLLWLASLCTIQRLPAPRLRKLRTVAQSGERLYYVEEVGGSSPPRPTNEEQFSDFEEAIPMMNT